MTTSSVSSIPLTASLRSASNPASPVTYARSPLRSPPGGGTMPRIVETAASATGVLSSVINAEARTTLLSGEISSDGPGPRSSGSVRPHPRPNGVPTSARLGIVADAQIARASLLIRSRSAGVRPPFRT